MVYWQDTRIILRKTARKGNLLMQTGCLVKICGITSVADAGLAAAAGADYIGVLIEVSYSLRRQTILEAEPIFASSLIPAVALVHEMPPDHLTELVTRLRPFAVQFLSQDGTTIAGQLKKTAPGLEIWQSLFLPAADDKTASFNHTDMLRQIEQCRQAGIDAVVLDTAAVIKGSLRCGGTGAIGRWDQAARIVAEAALPAFLAGGITPENVRAAVTSVRPHGIDLSSGVELRAGQKSPDKLRRLMEELYNVTSVQEGN